MKGRTALVQTPPPSPSLLSPSPPLRLFDPHTIPVFPTRIAPFLLLSREYLLGERREYEIGEGEGEGGRQEATQTVNATIAL